MTIFPVLVPIPQDVATRTPEHVRRQRAFARIALGESARRCGAPLDNWMKDADDVPLPQGIFRWSIAHTRKWAVAAIADHPIGVDIEAVIPRPEELMAEAASDEERKVLGDGSWRTFYRLWTAKEAVLKAVGVGLAGLADCRLEKVPDERHMVLRYAGGDWPIEHYFHANHVAAVTLVQDSAEWTVIDDVAASEIVRALMEPRDSADGA